MKKVYIYDGITGITNIMIITVNIFSHESTCNTARFSIAGIFNPIKYMYINKIINISTI